MTGLLLACLPIGLLILIAEYLWRSKRVHVETSRKIIHVGTGIIVAFLPQFLDWWHIQVLSIAMLTVIVVSYHLHIFQSIHAVKRITRGEILYPIGIAVCAFLEPAPWIFTAAILHLAVADGAAALVGLKWGKRTRYMLMSHGKSLVGSLAFFVVSVSILLAANVFQETLPTPFWLLIFTPAVLTMVENISWFGSDNITIPVMVIVLLSSLPT